MNKFWLCKMFEKIFGIDINRIANLATCESVRLFFHFVFQLFNNDA